MNSKFTLDGRRLEPPAEISGSSAEAPQAQSKVSLKDVPQEVFEDHLIPAAKALADGAVGALGGTAKYMHAQVVRGTAVPLAVMLRKHIVSSQVPALPDDLAVRNIAASLRPAGVSLGESMYALRRLVELFELRGHQKTWPELGHGPSRPETWCMEQIETALQVLLDGPDVGHLTFPAGLSEAFHTLKAARMRPLLQWASAEVDIHGANPFIMSSLVLEITKNAEYQGNFLDLSRYSVHEMPPIWLYAEHVEELKMLGGDMHSLPPELSQMNYLRRLNLGRCTNLSAGFFAVVPAGLKELTVVGAQLGNIGSDLLRLTHLQRLSLAYCNITMLPEKIHDLKNLMHLNLVENDFDEAMCDRVQSLEGLKSLNLSGCGLFRFGDRPLYPSNLEILDLRSNFLTTVPHPVSQLHCLKELDFSNNKITQIGYSLDDLKDLKKLSLRNNKLGVFEVYTEALQNLVHLNLSGNLFSRFPEQIFSCAALKTLDLSFNAIQSTPDSWARLAKLEELYLRGNDMSVADLGKSIGECRSLRKLEGGSYNRGFWPKWH